MTNIDFFCWNISSNIKLLLLKSAIHIHTLTIVMLLCSNVTMNRMQNCKYNYSLNIKNSEVQIFRE